jgi:hypothetical protein
MQNVVMPLPAYLDDNTQNTLHHLWFKGDVGLSNTIILRLVHSVWAIAAHNCSPPDHPTTARAFRLFAPELRFMAFSYPGRSAMMAPLAQSQQNCNSSVAMG